MAFADDIAGDYVIFDGGATVTLQQIRSNGPTPVTISNAIKQPLTRRMMQSLGGVSLDGREQVWSLNATQVGSVGVVEGDKVVESNNNVWAVIWCSLNTLSSRWDCVCRLEEGS